MKYLIVFNLHRCQNAYIMKKAAFNEFLRANTVRGKICHQCAGFVIIYDEARQQCRYRLLSKELRLHFSVRDFLPVKAPLEEWGSCSQFSTR